MSVDLYYLEKRESLQSFYTWNETMFIMDRNLAFSFDSIIHNICLSIELACSQQGLNIHSVLRNEPNLYLQHYERGTSILTYRLRNTYESDLRNLFNVTEARIQSRRRQLKEFYENEIN
jgi:hypothetical protein